MGRAIRWATVTLSAWLAWSAVAAAQAPAEGDVSEAIERFRDGLAGVVHHMGQRPDLFPTERLEEPRLLTRDQRSDVLDVWAAFSDYQIALDVIRLRERREWVRSGRVRSERYHHYRAAFLAQYRFALDFISIAENDASLEKVLNEGRPEVGLPAGTYDALELHYLNAAIALEFAALEALAGDGSGEGPASLSTHVERDRTAIWEMAGWRGPELTARNAREIGEELAFGAWFPLQTTVANAMGDIKLHRRGRALITSTQRKEMRAALEPGDILLTRREWYLSNIGLPGYWTHAAIYVGTAEERAAYFGASAPADPPTPPRLDEDRALPFRVIEAIGEGVVLTSFDHAAHADSIVALRPRLARSAKAVAIQRAFAYAGRPYDFNFDFRTDAALVCTELVYKSFQSSSGFEGLNLPVKPMLGRPALSANEIARLFVDERRGASPQLDFVVFLDGDERGGAARAASESAFAESWRRPKWHVLAAPASR